MRNSKVLYLFAGLSLSAFLGTWFTVRAQDAAAGTPPAPEFKSEKAKKQFESAQSLFKEGKYKEAARVFKRAARGAKSKEDKSVVDNWVKGCDGARYLEQVKALMKQNKLNNAHQVAAKIQGKCRGNPSEALFRQTLEDLEGRLFVLLENFDNPRGPYSAKYGKTFISDPKIVIPGKNYCLRWTHTRDGKAGVLKLKSIPRDLNRYHAIEFWMNYRVPPVADIAITCGKDTSKKKGPQINPQPRNISDAYYAKVRYKSAPGRWQLIRLEFNSFKLSGSPSLSAAKDIRFQIPGNKSFDFYIDDIRLMRKDPTTAQAAGGGRRR